MPIMPSLWSRRIRRRELVSNSAKIIVALALYDSILRPLVQPALTPPGVAPNRPVRFGSTFSQVKTGYMDLDFRKAFKEVLSLDLDFIRLGAYWSEIEPRKGEAADFRTLDWLLNEVEKQGRTELILTVGIRAPVFPEFHLPAWVHEEIDIPKIGIISKDPRLRDHALRFVRALIERYDNAKILKCIQVENEPFDPVLYDFQTYRFLGLDFVREEVELVRSLDHQSRPILLNTFVETSVPTNILANIEGNPLVGLITRSLVGQRERSAVLELADIVGYDVYPSVGWEVFGQKVYLQPWREADYNNLLIWRERAEIAGKAAYIMEAQAEPWEPGSAVHIAKREYPSFNPEAMEKFIDKLVFLGFRDICLWGVEHWLWHRQAGHPEWWDKGTNILSKYRTGS